jgi:rhodanese-related sulfurtransferase
MQRTITPEDFKAIANTAMVLDVRRRTDLETASEAVPGAFWKDPEQIDQWRGALPKNHDVVIYCVRGGGVSNSVVDQLHADGIQARYIEGGIEAYKAAGGKVSAR